MSGRCETDGDIVVIEYNWLNPFSHWVGEDYNKCKKKIWFSTDFNRIRNFIYNISFDVLFSIS